MSAVATVTAAAPGGVRLAETAIERIAKEGIGDVESALPMVSNPSRASLFHGPGAIQFL